MTNSRENHFTAHGQSARVDITVLVCTYNRCGDLRELLESTLVQKTDDAFRYEILVVDNNSKDDTRGIVQSLVAEGHTNLRYLFEGRQGRSYALNTGLKAVRGSIYAIADDDLILPPEYLKNVFESFQAHPEISFLGGKVLPLWKAEPPEWLTQRHWSAIAMSDRGENEFLTSEDHQHCLLAGAFRLAHVNAVGGYNVELGVSGVRIGGTEDADLFHRLYSAKRKGLYCPQLWLHHKVEPERLTRRYHRRWHTGHGSQYAVMREAQTEQGSTRLFDVPAYMYRQFGVSAISWLKHCLTGQEELAMIEEATLFFIWGFYKERRASLSSQTTSRTLGDLFSFARAILFTR
ncbi:MAG: glycosyltransferase [Acidobacteriota bacterium]